MLHAIYSLLLQSTFMQAFWQGARVRGRTIRSKPHNPAQFMKTREIPHNMERFD